MMKTIYLLPLLLVPACAGPGHYYGGYEVACSGRDASAVHDEAVRIAADVSKALKRPLMHVSATPPALTLMIAAPPPPSIAFSYEGTREPNRLYISVTAPDPEGDAATREAQEVIENTLKHSACAAWQFRLGHISLAGG